MSEVLATHERAVRDALARRGCSPGSLTLLGAGLDHAAYAVDDRLVVRVATDSSGEAWVRREAELLRRVAAISPLPVPCPVWSDPEAGCLAYRLLPGRPLLHLADRASYAEMIGARLGGLLAVLHSQPTTDWSDVVAVDVEPPSAWRSEAERHYDTVRDRVPTGHRSSIEDFLAVDPPAGAYALALCHNDLGIEHVLVEGGAICGIVDWSDAALTDPARDLALLYRDLGRPALAAALAAYPADCTDQALLRRIEFFARCAALEDLAYGLTADQPVYAEKTLDGLPWLFPPKELCES